MVGETVPRARFVSKIDNDNFQLTIEERRLICNFRAMRKSARDALVDMSEEFRLTLPVVGAASAGEAAKL